MWVFTQDGFVSAVQQRGEDDVLAVRARDRASLESLAELVEKPILVSAPDRDYEYRVLVTKEEFTKWMQLSIEFIDYPNFKNRVWDNRGDVYHDACSSVWGTMLSVSDKRHAKI